MLVENQCHSRVVMSFSIFVVESVFLGRICSVLFWGACVLVPFRTVQAINFDSALIVMDDDGCRCCVLIG